MSPRRNWFLVFLSMAVLGALIVAATSQMRAKTDKRVTVVQRDGKELLGPGSATKVNETFALDNADLGAAIKALGQLRAFRDVSIAAPNTGSSHKVSLRVAPGTKTVGQLLAMVADLYGRTLSVERGAWVMRAGGGIFNLTTPNTTYRNGLPFERNLVIPPFAGQTDFKGIAERLRKSAEELRKASKAEDQEGLAKMLRDQADALDKAAKELEKSGGMPNVDSFLKQYRLSIPDGGSNEWEWGDGTQLLTPEKEQELKDLLKQHGLQGGKGLDLIPETGKGEGPFTLRMGGGEVGALIKSITDEQWALQKKQGYLKFSDLTDRQRKMLGTEETGADRNFSMKIEVNGKELDIRSK